MRRSFTVLASLLSFAASNVSLADPSSLAAKQRPASFANPAQSQPMTPNFNRSALNPQPLPPAPNPYHSQSSGAMKTPGSDKGIIIVGGKSAAK